MDGEHRGILPAPGRVFRLNLTSFRVALGRRRYASFMETPKEDTHQTPEDDAEEAAKKAAADVESYESEWYEVLKRRAAELEEAGEDDEAAEEDKA